MKYMMAVSTLCFLALHASGTQPKKILVAVEMSDHAEIRAWHQLGPATYEFIGKTAIAEIDEPDIQFIRHLGFSLQVIDESPWTENYFIGTVPQPETELPGQVIWQKNAVRIVKSATAQISDFKNQRLDFRLLRRNLLSERLWDQITIKKVPLRDLVFDPFIQSLVNQVNADSLASYTQRLQDFQTRLLFTDSGFAASEWIRQKFNSFGYVAEFDSFYLTHTDYGTWPDTGYERNVVARIQGVINPTRVFIISGHHDAIIWPDTQNAWIFAPGADDNASAVAALFEAARIFHNYTWEPSIEFITWAAEEVGLLGSDDYARRVDSLNLDIGAVVNLDMIGWTNGGQLNCNIHHTYDYCLWLSSLFYQAGQLYAPELTYFEEYWPGGSDDLSFSSRGFPSIWGAERWYYQNPNWHRPSDTLSNMTPELHTGIAKASVATLAIFGLYPSPVNDVMVVDIGDGNSLQVSWSPNIEPDIVGYRIYWGLESEVYTDSQYIVGISMTTDTLTGLMNDSTYYIAVRAMDTDNRLSYMATEVTGTPRLVPLAPSGVTATPIAFGIDVNWLRNQELDIVGYRLYRRLNDNPVYDSLNTVLLTDTTFTDYPLSGDNRYYYAARAFDLTGNYSGLSAEAYGRPITLDQGILIVDETRNGTNPPDSLQDAFYQYIMAGYPYTEYEYGSAQQAPVLADLVPYSSVLWHADDYADQFASDHIPDFRTYLDLGGNMWFMGWRPTANLEGQTLYPYNFSAGDFMYDYYKVEQVEQTPPLDSFQAADGLLGYPRLDVDSAKVPFPGWHGVLRYIEALTPVVPADSIYTMDMRNNSSSYEDAVCGMRYLGNDFNVVFFGFPLYFMDQDQARVAAQQVMSDFGEVGVEEMPKSTAMLSGIVLQQNIPNPFVEQTLIGYQQDRAGRVSLRIYNIAGQLIKTLVDAQQEPGVYTVTWSGLDERGRRLSSGIYFCRLQSEDESALRKIILSR
jgi:hypothetical protein